MLIKNKTAWIAWERHRRTIELCNYLKITPEIYDDRLPRSIKYITFGLRTIWFLAANRPKTVIVQNPSIVLTILTCLLKEILNYKLYVDSHNAAILPEMYIKIHKIFDNYIMRRADSIIVTNNNMANIVIEKKGNPFVLPDILPVFDIVPLYNDCSDYFKIICICTYNIDEPYKEMIKAANALRKYNIRFIFTGNNKKLSSNIEYDSYENIQFTGYLPDKEYIALLGTANLIMDLTNRDNCLVCGAYEAVACGVPLILSNFQTLRTYFYKGAVFTENTSTDIKAAILYGKEHYFELKEEISRLKDELNFNWEELGRKFSYMVTESR